MMRLIVAAAIALSGISRDARASYTCDIANAFASQVSSTVDQLAAAQQQASAAGLTMTQVEQAVSEFAAFQQEAWDRAVDTFKKGCKPGDQLVVPFPATAQALCDASQPVARHGDATVCTMRQLPP